MSYSDRKREVDQKYPKDLDPKVPSKFFSLNELSEDSEMLKKTTTDQNDNAYERKQQQKKKSKRVNHLKKMTMKKICPSSPIALHNRFAILQDNSEETISSIKKRNEINLLPKKSLPKCRTCNFKKRSCATDRLYCSAMTRQCFFCDKRGHYQNSMNCKKQKLLLRKDRKKTVQKFKKTKGNESIEIDKELILRRIKVIEYQSQLKHTAAEEEYDYKYLQLIPFFMMYLFLNYDCFLSKDSKTIRSNLLIEAKKELNSIQCIRKLIKYWSKRLSFVHQEHIKKKLLKRMTKNVMKVLNINYAEREEFFMPDHFTFDKVKQLVKNDCSNNLLQDVWKNVNDFVKIHNHGRIKKNIIQVDDENIERKQTEFSSMDHIDIDQNVFSGCEDFYAADNCYNEKKDKKDSSLMQVSYPSQLIVEPDRNKNGILH